MTSFFSRLASFVTGDEAPISHGEQFTIHGVPVVVNNTRPDIATADVVERLTEALGLIAAHQPWRLRTYGATSRPFASNASPVAAPIYRASA